MNLIFIHGRGQQEKEAIKERQLWIDAWKKGLEKSGIEFPEEINIIFPFYGVLLYELKKGKADPTTLEGIIARGQSSEDLTLYYEILMEILIERGFAEADVRGAYGEEIVERGVLNWSWVRAVARFLDEKSERIGDFTMGNGTSDVAFYLSDKFAHKKVNELVAGAIGDQPCTVVAHSLGSVIAYNVLKVNPVIPVDKLITLGSPLGMSVVKRKLSTPLAVPKCLKNGWYNAYDPRDFVPLFPLDDAHFIVGSGIENSGHVNNDGKDPHDIAGYLSDQAIAKIIYDSLKGNV